MAINNVDICCGLAWGDEAKGKIVSQLIQYNKYDWICRWSGGNNAGHTIYVNGIKYATHIIPAGVFYGIPCYIGPDCYINFNAFTEEIEYLKTNGFDVSKIYISGKAHVITDEHIDDDNKNYKKQQGSTGSGIAPCAKDKFARKGVQVKDCKNFPYNIWNETVSPLYGDILCEGAQGFWLDINYGEYPFVTSANTLPYSACSLGFPHQVIRNIYGAAKVYDTRVGVDPSFEHDFSETYESVYTSIAKIGEEYGTTTKRLRKVQWLNIDKLINAINISGTNHVIISKIDILEKMNSFVYIFNDNYCHFETKEDFIKNINDIILNKCDYVEKIIYSDNPITVDLLNNSSSLST
tara:strand:+ start:521 stop:1573 length:1053 start_codon:yes stop_codon:yes gene_type:complete